MTTATTSRSLDPRARAIWSGARGPLVLAALVLLGAVLLALAASGQRSGTLDPRAADRPGSRALAELLRQQGVSVELVQTTDAAVAAVTATPRSTLLVAVPDLLVAEQVGRIAATAADLVLVAPSSDAALTLAPGVRPARGIDGDARDPVCSLPAAARAGRAEVGGIAYALEEVPGRNVTGCYPVGNDATLAQTVGGTSADRLVTVIGTGRPFTNDRLARQGNAALMLGLLGRHDRLVWYLPSLSDVPDSGKQSLWSLTPRGVKLGLAQLLVAVVLLALWRARRLGPVVEEALPVVVRAAETVEGRARLYRKAGARDSASAALRRASVERLLPVVSLPRRSHPTAVVAAVAARTGRSPVDVDNLLYGAAPADDQRLVALADALDQLEREVRRP